MGLIFWVAIGLIAGVVAKIIMPGKDPGGLIITIIIGMAGAFLGGFISSLMGFGSIAGFDARSLLIAVGGSILLLAGYRLLKKNQND